MSSSSRQAKVCHVQLLPINSGVQKYTTLIFESLAEEFDCTLVCSEDGPFPEQNRRMGVRVQVFPSLCRDLHPFRDLKSFTSLYAYFKRERFDIVHTHSSKTGIVGRLAAFLARCPVIIHHVHGFSFHQFSRPWEKLVYINSERLAGAVSSKLVFVNREEQAWAERHLVSSRKSALIQNGVDAPNTAGKRLSQAQGRKIVGFVGRLCQQKDPETLYRTFCRLAQEGIQCWIIGDGPCRADLQARARQDLGSQSDNIIFWGWQEDVSLFLERMDVFVLPSLWEGLSFALLEAMAQGIPAVVSDVKGNRDLISHGVNGHLVTPGSVNGFVASIQDLLHNETQANKMGEESRELIRTTYSKAMMIERTRKLYQHLLSNGGCIRRRS